jgi:predicted GIY-YIG superfamily endonuclease
MINNENYVVYILKHSTTSKTYVGITNNKKRRLRQHNCEIKGGAKYTTINKEMGEWYYYGFICNLDKRTALSLEKRIKIKSKKQKGNPIERRKKAIELILSEYNTLNLANLTFDCLVE